MMHASDRSANPKPNETAELFDARGLPAPENVLAILKKASALPNGAELEVWLDSNPFQLYDLLQQRGYFLEMTGQLDGTYRGKLKQREVEKLRH